MLIACYFVLMLFKKKQQLNAIRFEGPFFYISYLIDEQLIISRYNLYVKNYLLSVSFVFLLCVYFYASFKHT